MNLDLLLLKLGAVAACAGASGLALGLLAQPGTSAERGWQRYMAHTDRSLRNMFLVLPVQRLSLAQLALIALLGVTALAFRSPELLLPIPVVLLGPTLVVWLLERVRVRKIEAALDTFVLALSNALRTTPSIGSALAHVEQLAPPPLNRELALTLREMRLGTSLDQALLNMAERIGSVKLDAAISGLLIARQVGGDVAETLATTAQSLREMARLEGVLRTKTAAGRAQLWLLAVFPAAIVLLFDTVRPGYFAVLGGSVAGMTIVATAIALWVVSLFIARRVLSVDL